MDLNNFSRKNRYLFPEEIKQLLDNLELYNNKQNRDPLKKCIKLIYAEGHKIKEAICLSKVNNIRSVQRTIKKYSNNLITLRDLRKSYLYDHPKDNIIQRKKRELSPRLRWKILCRDNFSCVACGKSSRETKLHIDHIYPKSLGGEDNPKNLRVLCEECNLGKGNLFLDLDLKINK